MSSSPSSKLMEDDYKEKESKTLPPDMVYEVVSRIKQLEIMDKCKSINKDWKELISTSSFMSSYCKKTKNLFGYIVQSRIRTKIIQQFVSPNYKIEDQEEEELRKNFFRNTRFRYDNVVIEASSMQGILFCNKRIRTQHHRYYIGKPMTNQWYSIPQPRRTCIQPYATIKAGLAILNSNPLCFKIFRISKPTRLL